MEAFDVLRLAAKRSNSAFIISVICLIVVLINNNVYLKTIERREKLAQRSIEDYAEKHEQLLLFETELKKRETELAISAEKWRAEWEKQKKR